jgi:hypothetical protein
LAIPLCSTGSRTTEGPPPSAETATEGEKTDDETRAWVDDDEEEEAETTPQLFAAPGAPPPPAREGEGTATDHAAREGAAGGESPELENSSDRRTLSPEEAIRR